MRIGFYAGNSIPVHANSLEERPLGGTETALIRLVSELDKRGHEVIVFTSLKNPPQSKPQYIFHGRLLEMGKFDLLVVVQDWKAISYGASFDRAFFWSGDGWDQYANFGIGDLRIVKKFEKFLCVSNWQAKTICEKSGFPFEKTSVIGNGVHLPYFEGSEDRHRKRVIYASAPYRGLALVPAIFNELRKKHSDAELHVFAGMSVYDTEKKYDGPEAVQAQEIGKYLKTLPGVFVHNNVLQSQLAREMMRSSVLFYPNIVYETCCIVAMEAQAAGCPVVTSNVSALPETVGKSGILVDGVVGSPQYMRDCLSALDLLLSDDEMWKKLSKFCRNRAIESFGWEKVADRFEALL